MAITLDGTTGITTPTVSFSGDVPVADKIVHSGDTDTAIRFPDADTVTVETGGTERFRVDSSGNVGIGVENPTSKLDVSGTINATALSVGGTAVTATAAELNSVGGVISNIQTQLNGKLSTSGTAADSDLLDGQHGSYYHPTNLTILERGADITGEDWNEYWNGTEASWNTVLNASGLNKPPAYEYGTAISFGKAGQAQFQLYASDSASSGGGLFYRSSWNNASRPWVEIWDSGNDGSGSGLDADLLDGQQGSYYQPASTAITTSNIGSQSVSYAATAGSATDTTKLPLSGGTLTGTLQTRTSTVNTSYGGSTGTIEIMSNSGGGAVFSLHRAGVYAVNIGLDTDNVFRIGGWSAGANRLQMDMSGNLTMAGNVTAYSDARLKTDLQPIPDALDKVMSLTGYTYTRIDSGERHTGVVAQDVQKVLPEAVNDGGEYMSVAYGNMVGLLIEAIKELKAEVEDLKTRLEG
jgi:hypothetical protein